MNQLNRMLSRFSSSGSHRLLVLVVVVGALLLLGYALGYTLGSGQTAHRLEAERHRASTQQAAALAEVVASRDRLQAALQDLQAGLSEQQTTAQVSTETLNAVQQNLAVLRQDYAALRERFETQTNNLAAAEADVAQLRAAMAEQNRAHTDTLAQQAAQHQEELERQQALHEQERSRLRAALLQAGLDGALADTHGAGWDQQLATFERQLALEREALQTLQRQWQDVPETLITELRDGSAIISFTDVALFESGATWPSEEGVSRLSELAELLRALPDHLVTVEGHTDARPLTQSRTASVRDNWALSAVRAAATVSTLEDLGIGADRLRAVGYASNRPVTDDPTAAANRRVELLLYPPIEQRVLRLRQNQGVRAPEDQAPADAAASAPSGAATPD